MLQIRHFPAIDLSQFLYIQAPRKKTIVSWDFKKLFNCFVSYLKMLCDGQEAMEIIMQVLWIQV